MKFIRVLKAGYEDYAVAWQEFDRNDRIVTKRKEFKTEKQLKAFVEKLEQKNNFYQILAFSDGSHNSEN